MTTFVDTQILIDAFTGAGRPSVTGARVSSIAANEFLQVQSSTPNKANYYLPLIPQNMVKAKHVGAMARALHAHPRRRSATDSVVMDFGGEYETLVEFGNVAVADVINHQAADVFSGAIAFLPKDRRKRLRSKFEFLLEHSIVCVALGGPTVRLGHRLLAEFVSQYSIKERFRNSWNDILIAATALREGTSLVTRDGVLNRFVADRHATSFEQLGGNLRIDFPSPSQHTRTKSRESKGYVNRRWTMRFSRPGGGR